MARTVTGRALQRLGIVIVLSMLGTACSSSGTAPSDNLSLSGTWAGRASGVETADFTFILVHAGNTLSGTGDVSFPGDGNRFLFDASGSLSGSNVTITIQLRPTAQDPNRPPITCAAAADGGKIVGKLMGGNIQHDGPFAGTPLTLSKQ